jgi:hypothetical protein
MTSLAIQPVAAARNGACQDAIPRAPADASQELVGNYGEMLSLKFKVLLEI